MAANAGFHLERAWDAVWHSCLARGSFCPQPLQWRAVGGWGTGREESNMMVSRDGNTTSELKDLGVGNN